MHIVNIANGTRLPNIWTDPFVDELQSIGELELIEWGSQLDDDEVAATVRRADVAIVGWEARPLPLSLADDRGRLAYVCCYSGTIRSFVPRELVAAGIPVSNWGDLPAPAVAEGAMTLLLAMLHELPRAHDTLRSGGYGFDLRRQGSLADLAVGVYGYGVIGRRFVEMLRPFGARVRVYDPYVTDLPEGVDRADSLAELCTWCEALVIHAGWSDETDQSVTAEVLACLPDGGIVVNTARGGIIDQDALFAEVTAGRLRAGLDVLEPEELDSAHAIRQSDSLAFTYHLITNAEWPVRPGLDAKQALVLAQLRRFEAGEPIPFLFDVDRYDRST